jgi:hypothetical protein
MATTKATTTASKKKGSAKKSAKRLTSRGDPPIVIGGGGSTYIWILKSTNPQLISPTAPLSPPANPADYYCFFCNVDIQTIEVDDGVPGPGKHKIKPDGDMANGGKIDAKKHRTVFS